MSDSKAAQAARNEADRRLREAHRKDWESFMNEAFESRGLTWNPRPSKEEREAREAAAKQEKARERILREAKKAGLTVRLIEMGAQPGPYFDVAEATAAGLDDDKAWADMTEAEREAVAGTRAPRSDAEEAAAWGETA